MTAKVELPTTVVVMPNLLNDRAAAAEQVASEGDERGYNRVVIPLVISERELSEKVAAVEKKKQIPA